MDDLTIRAISLFILGVVIGVFIAYNLHTMRRIAREQRLIYRDYARRFIAGVAGGLTVFIATDINRIAMSALNDDLKMVSIGVDIAIMLFVVVFSLSMFVEIERRYLQSH